MKRYRFIAILYFVIMAYFVLTSKSLTMYATTLDYVGCGSASGIPKPIPQLTTVAYTLLIVGTPLILITFSIVALIKAISGGKADEILKAKTKLFKKFMAAGIIFLLSAIVQFVIGRVTTTVDDESTVTACLQCFLYYSDQNCYKSSSGNGVTEDTTNPTYDDKAQPTTGNRDKTPSGNVSNGTIKKGSKTILVGDSRTVGICQLSSSGYYSGACRDYNAVCQGGMGYNWFKATGVAGVNGLLEQNANTRHNIVILLGVNDISNTEYWADNAVKEYMGIITEHANGDWKNQNIIFASITPIGAEQTGGKWPVSQTNINYFNTQIRSKIASSGLSNVSYCDISTGIDLNGKFAGDNLHYTGAGYTTMYNQIVNKCLK